MHLQHLLAGLLLLSPAWATFLLPPPAGLVGDYSTNPNYTLGDSIQLKWIRDKVGEGALTDLVLWQVNTTTGQCETGSFLASRAL